MRTTPEEAYLAGTPDRLRVTPWTPLDPVGEIDLRKFLQFRIDFTVPDGLPPDADLPYVDRIAIALR